MQRLFSTFPGGLPGAGLVLLRAITAIPLLHSGVVTAASPSPVILELVAAAAGILLLIGLWTPFAGALVAIAEIGLAVFHLGDPWTSVQYALLGAAIAMLGPGASSLDARLFGRKQIQIPRR